MDEQKEKLYRQAKMCYLRWSSETGVKEALELFEKLGDYKQAPQFLEKCRTLQAYSVGNTVEYGAMDGQPLRWRVIDQRGKMRLLFAESSVVHRPFNDVITDVSWKTCSLRTYLNGPFLNEAFTVSERAQLSAGVVRAARNAKYYSNGGDDALDKVYILSMEEAEQYFPEAESRASGEWWWLRNPGCNLLSAISVYNDGSIYEAGIHVNYELGGVRPAMWVLLKV